MSSTSELIIALSEAGAKDGYTLSPESAFLLYAGLIGDTDRFKFSNTSPLTLQRAAVLLEQGIAPHDLYTNLYKRDLALVRIEGYVLQHFKLVSRGVGVMRLTKEILAQFSISSNDSARLINCFSDVEGMIAWVFLIEEDERIRVRLRSKGPVINTIAEEHNGGGHPLAAGATACSWEEAEQIVEKLTEAVAAFSQKSTK